MRARRKELKIRQDEAAALADCDKSTWNRWEAPEYIPHEKNFPAIAKALDLKIEDLRRAVMSQIQGALGEYSVQMKLDGGDSPKAAPLADYEFKNEALAELADRLEIDLTSIPDPRMQLYLSEWRGLIRGQLINADVLFQTHQQSVATYRLFAVALLGLPKSVFRFGDKVVRVKAKKT